MEWEPGGKRLGAGTASLAACCCNTASWVMGSTASAERLMEDKPLLMHAAAVLQ